MRKWNSTKVRPLNIFGSKNFIEGVLNIMVTLHNDGLFSQSFCDIISIVVERMAENLADFVLENMTGP